MGIVIGTRYYSDYRTEHAYYGQRTGGNWGAMAGAGAGAAIGRKLGGKTAKGQAIGALAGGIVGGIGGFIGGRKLGKKVGRKLGSRSENKRFEVTYKDLDTGLERHKRFDYIQDAQMFQKQHPGAHVTDLHQQGGGQGEDWS